MSDSIKLKLKSNLRSSNKKLLKQDITNNFPQLWNKLPITVTNENNTNTFKSKLHKYLLGLDWYNLTHPYNIPTATELSNRFTLYFYLIQYPLLKNQYSTTLFSIAYITFHFYYLLLTNLTTILYLLYTYIYIWLIFSIYCPLYSFPICIMYIAHFPHMQFPLTWLHYTYYHNYYLDFIYFEKRIYYINCVIFR